MLQLASPRSGLLLVGHGTRSAAGRTEFLRTADMVAAALSEVPVEPCFLELAEPAIGAGVARLMNRSVRQVVVVPLLLFSAGHTKRDIPAAVRAALEPYPGVSVLQSPHLGCDEELLELSAQRFRELGLSNLSDTAFLLVGRGSVDVEATAEMHRFTELRAERTPVGLAATCFLAMAEPSLATTLAAVAGQGLRRVIVQPHLLFHGDLLDGLQAEVSAARERWPDCEWLVVSHLGAAPLLVDAIVTRFRGMAALRS